MEEREREREGKFGINAFCGIEEFEKKKRSKIGMFINVY